MTDFPPLTYDEVADLIDYNPDTGSMTWRTDNRRVKKGQPVGALTPDGYLSVVVKGHKLRGQYLAWLLGYGDWPLHKLRLKSAIGIDPNDPAQLVERRNLRLDNIVPEHEVESKRPETVKQRFYNRERRRMQALHDEQVLLRDGSPYPEVHYSRDARQWWVSPILSLTELRATNVEHTRAQKRDHTLAWFDNKSAAERFVAGMYANRDKLHDPNTGGELNTAATIPPDLIHATAGAHGPSLVLVHTRLAYDATEGEIFWRTGPKRYQNALTKTTGRTSYVLMDDRRLPAHSLAFFMARGVWPVRGKIHPRNGNWRDIHLDNLIYTLDYLEPPREGMEL